MAKDKAPAFAVNLPDSFKAKPVSFGKADKIVKLAVSRDGDNWIITPEGQFPTGVLFVGRDGQTFVADFSRYPEAMSKTLMFHGTKQKLGDEYADLDSIDDCLEAVRELDGRLAEGKWTADRQGFAGISVLMRAIMKVYNITEEAARDFLKPLSAKEKLALRAAPELKPTIDEIEAERAKGAKTDTQELLKKLQLPKA